MWKLSQFTVVRNLADRNLPTQHLIFNTSSGKCMVAREENWSRIMLALENPGDAEDDVQKAVQQLVKSEFVVEATRNERNAWGKEFDSVRYNRKSIFPLLAVTTACNIGCTYCYEEGVVYETMSSEVISGCIRWMEKRIVIDGVREIYPGLFGGEPLLYPKLLIEIMERFLDLCRRYGIRGHFYSSSNGMLLTDDLAAQLAALGLTQLQISLDGPPQIHDQRRIGKRNQPTFTKSIEGIKTAVRHIPSVTVKVNFDRHNRPFMRGLFDLLVTEGLSDRVTVKLEAIAYQMEGSRQSHHPALVIPPESNEMAEAYVELALECKRRGIKVTQDTAHTTPCMFSSDHGVIIGPDGSIYKCISLVGRKEFKVGNVLEEEYDQVEYGQQMNSLKRMDECFEENCPYIPVCAGGCAYEAIVRTGSYKQRFCTKTFLSKFHYLQYLARYEQHLVTLGMRPLTSEELAESATIPKLELPTGQLVKISVTRRNQEFQTSPQS